jgi:hypothetical protein
MFQLLQNWFLQKIVLSNAIFNLISFEGLFLRLQIAHKMILKYLNSLLGTGTIASPIKGNPDWLNLVSMFSGPRTAEPISLKRTFFPPSERMIILNSSAVDKFPTVLRLIQY